MPSEARWKGLQQTLCLVAATEAQDLVSSPRFEEMGYGNFRGHVNPLLRRKDGHGCRDAWHVREGGHVGPGWRLSYQMKIFKTLHLVRVLCTIHKPPTHRLGSDSLSSEVLLGDFTTCQHGSTRYRSLPPQSPRLPEFNRSEWRLSKTSCHP